MGNFVHKNDNLYYVTNTQLKIAGNVVELRRYGRDFFIGDRPKSIRDKVEKTATIYTNEEIQLRRYRRAKKELIDYINCNSYKHKSINDQYEPPIFVTLTFKKNIKNIFQANRDYSKFIQKFNWLITNKKKRFLKYVVVIEFQKRGSIHYHVLFFNLHYIPDIKIILEALWGHGFIKLKAIDRVKNISLYMAKYMSKRFDDPRLRGKKCYFASRDLIRPTLVYYDELINQFLSFLPEQAVTKDKPNLPAGYMVSLDFKQYDLRNYPNALSSALDFLEGTGYDGPGHTPPKEEMVNLSDC